MASMLLAATARRLPWKGCSVTSRVLASRHFSNIPDVKVITDTQRKVLGCPDYTNEIKDAWKDSPINIDGKELTIQGHPVMEAWEHPYMCRLAEIATCKGGKVLELGFGMNISANYIQKNKNSEQHPLEEHVIIEANNNVADRADKWATTDAKSKVRVCRGYSWDVAPTLADGYFDGILYDTYPLKAGSANRHQLEFFKDAARLLKVGGTFTYFCNEDIDISAEEKQMLIDVGFDVTTEQVPVPTPDDCKYWRAKTIVAPTCVKVR